MVAQPSMNPGAWSFRFSPGMPAHPSRYSDPPGWVFLFPQYGGALPCADHLAPSCPSVHYLTAAMPGPLHYGHSIIVNGQITATLKTRFHCQLEPGNTDPQASSTMRLFLQRRGDEDLNSDYGRFWSSPQKLELEPQKFRLVVPLIAGRWQSVFGHMNNAGAALAGFVSLLANIQYIGMTFGGGNSFGHGVNVRGGPARMIVRAYRIAA